MPPYESDDYSIALNKNALNGSRMSGYSAIKYDLARYVLIDHFASNFIESGYKNDEQIKDLIEKVSMLYPEYKDINYDQFFISAAYEFIKKMGWNEKDFYNLTAQIPDGLDIAILGRYRAATHGSQSPVMTVCEKYIWQLKTIWTVF